MKLPPAYTTPAPTPAHAQHHGIDRAYALERARRAPDLPPFADAPTLYLGEEPITADDLRDAARAHG